MIDYSFLKQVASPIMEPKMPIFVKGNHPSTFLVMALPGAKFRSDKFIVVLKTEMFMNLLIIVINAQWILTLSPLIYLGPWAGFFLCMAIKKH